MKAASSTLFFVAKRVRAGTHAVHLDALNTLLRRDAKTFSAELSKLAYDRGLAVTNKDGTTRPIPITATAVVRDGHELKRRAALSAHLSSATFKMSQSVLAGEAKELLLSALS